MTIKIHDNNNSHLDNEIYRERLEITLAGTGCGTFFHDFTNNLIHWDDRSQKILGITKEALSFEDWLGIIHIADRRPTVSYVEEELAKKNPHINIEYRIVKNNELHYVKVDTYVKYENGNAHSTYGLLQDITKLKEQQIELEVKNRELERTAKELSAALKEIKVLQGIIPICAYCHSIRDDAGSWSQLEAYISAHSEAKFSHGICPE